MMAAYMDPSVCLMRRKPWGKERDRRLQESWIGN